MTQFPDLFAALAAPFDPKEVKAFRKGPATLTYVTARTVMNRLDAVLGPESWWDSYAELRGGLTCCLTVRLPDGSSITKQDGAGAAGMADAGDDEKSAYSEAFKRAAYKFGVGRYLYRDGTVDYGVEGHAPTPEGPAREPAPAPAQSSAPARRPAGGGGNGHHGDPRTGKALFAWTKKAEEEFGVELLKGLNDWAKKQGIEGRMVDWSEPEVAKVFAAARRKVESLGGRPAGREPGED